MRRTTRILALAVMLCMVAVLTLTSCNFDLSGEGTFTSTDEGKEACLESIKGFMEDTLKKANYVVTTKSGDEIKEVETVSGTSGLISVKFEDDETKVYVFVKDGTYYMASENGDSQFYLTGEKYYKNYYNHFMSAINTIESIPADSGTFTCTINVVGKFSTEGGANTNTTSTMEFTYVKGESSLKLTATSKDNLVQSMTVEVVDAESGSRTSVCTFEYGSASVTVPDVSGWTDMTDDVISIY